MAATMEWKTSICLFLVLGLVDAAMGAPAAMSLGLNTHTVTPKPGEMEMIVNATFKWIRTDFPWSEGEKQAGVYNFTMWQPYMSLIAKNKLNLIAIIDCQNPLYNGGKVVTTPTGRAAFAKYAAAIAVAFPFSQYGVHWELCNEPNDGVKYHTNGTAYGLMMQAVLQSVHAATSDVRVVGPASENIDVAFLQQAFETGVLQELDAVTIHPYRSDSPETAIQDFATVNALVQEYSPFDRTVPVWSGEWGYGSNGPITEDVQAQLLARQFLTTIASGAAVSIWYDWRGDANMGVVEVPFQPGSKLPYAPKPAYFAAQTLGTQLGAREFVGRVPVFQNGYNTDDDFMLVFRHPTNAADVMLALWTMGSFEHVVRLPGGRGCYDVVNYLGEPLPQICEDPRGIHVNVTSGPQYLVAKSA